MATNLGSMSFDAGYYLENNQDVLKAVLAGTVASAQVHWETFGCLELRDPNAYFDTSL